MAEGVHAAKGRVLAGMTVVPNAGRIALAVGTVSAVFSALQLVTWWATCTNPWVAVAAWALVPAVVVGGVAVGTRRGGTSPAVFMAGCVAVLYGVDLLVMAVLPPAERYGPAAWNWGAVATTLLALSPYRPAREVVIAAVGHAGIGAAAVTVADPGARIDGVAVGEELTTSRDSTPVEVVGSLEGLGRDDTTYLIALVGLLRGFTGWRSVRITVGGSAVVAVVVTAAGPAALAAASDPSVRAAAADLGGEVRLAPPDVLFVETRRPSRGDSTASASERHTNG
ncbi:hypothetical protein [Saccharothrix sp. Mg75]|uniref:hypothetical protein n=1 Tax=Saccharothrix sp. Mg75 TaxID=3445357 RepID=UPI003EE84369